MKPLEFESPSKTKLLNWGHIVEGWNLKDYLVHAVKNNGYEVVLIWGKQGSAKSSFMLDTAYKLFGDWNKVLKYLFFTPYQLIDLVFDLKHGERYDVLLWDDVGVHFPSLTYRTDAELYQEMGKYLDAQRTSYSVLIATAPIVTRFPKVLRDSATFEIFLNRLPEKLDYSKYIVLRLIRSFHHRSLDQFFFQKWVIEEDEYFIYSVPSEVWDKYWELRLKLGEQARESFKRKVKDSYVTLDEDLLTPVQACQYLQISIQSLMNLTVRGFIPNVRVGKQVYFRRTDLKEIYEHIRRKRGRRSKEEI